jgi:hypothetical protein
MEARQEPTRAEAIIGLSLSGKLLAMPANGATNALAYQATELITTVKSFMVQRPGTVFTTLFFLGMGLIS